MKHDMIVLAIREDVLLRPDAPAIQILNSLNTGVIVCDARGRISFSNLYASEILKYPKNEIEQLNVGTLLFPIKEMAEILKAGSQEQSRQEKNIRLQNKEEITIGYHISEVKEAKSDPESWQYAITFQDITKWNALHRDRDRLLKIATVGDILPTILHELKNPLAAITTAVEVLLEEVEEISASETKTSLQAILSEIRRMKLVFEGIGSTHRELHCNTPMAVDEAIREAVFVLNAKAKSAGLRMTCEIEKMPSLFLNTAVVRAILFNLLTNAIDACRSGNEIKVSARCKAAADLFELVVSDNGCGMPASVKAHCTELFVTTKPSGSGIGLSLCKNTVESAGGSLEIESEVDQGTRITVTVPLSAPKHTGSNHAFLP